MDFAFAEPDPDKPRRTRGALVVYHGRIVAERYAPGFDKSTAHLSNSVAKSFTSALVGILVGQGKLKVDDPAPIAEWHGEGDPRAAITLDNLLAHVERARVRGELHEDQIRHDVSVRRRRSCGLLGGEAARGAARARVGSYSTGTSNILGRIVRQAAGATFAEAFAFPRRALFDKLGMRNTVIEVDAAGNFVGGSFVFASVRDYARLGLLYLRRRRLERRAHSARGLGRLHAHADAACAGGPRLWRAVLAQHRDEPGRAALSRPAGGHLSR